MLSYPQDYALPGTRELRFLWNRARLHRIKVEKIFSDYLTHSDDLRRIIRKEKGWGITPAFSVDVKHKDKPGIDTSN